MSIPPAADSFKLQGASGRGVPPPVTPQTKDKEDAKGKSVTFLGGTRIDTRSAPCIRGLIEHCSVSMLVDTGSAVTINRADIWENKQWWQQMERVFNWTVRWY